MKDFKWTKAFTTTALCLSMIGCANMEEEVADNDGRQTEVVIKEHKKTPSVIEVISPLKVLNENAKKLDLPTRQGEAWPKPALTYRLADQLKKRSKTPKAFDEKIPFTLQIANGQLVEAMEMMKASLGFEYFIDPGVRGTVTADVKLVEENMITRYAAWNLFEQILYMNGAYASLDPSGALRIVPFTKMTKEKRLLIKGDPKGNAAVELIQLNRNSASSVLQNLRPFLTDGASATILERSNSILLVDTPANMEKVHALVKMLDNKGQAGWPQFAYQCINVDSATLLADLQTLIPVLGFTLTQGNNADPSGIKIGSLDRISVLVFSAPTLDVLNEVKRWVTRLDVTDAEEQGDVFYYPVKHGVSSDLVDAMATFFTDIETGGGSNSSSGSGRSTSSRAGGGSNSNSGSGGGIRAQQLNRNTGQRTPNAQRRPTTSTGVRTSGNGEAPLTVFDMPARIYEDIRRNQLVIKTTPRTYAVMQAILNHLDAPPMQVLIQITAVEVNLNDDLQYGFEFASRKKFGDGELDFGSGNSVINPAVLLPAGSVSPGISALLSKAGVDNEFAFVQAVAGKTDSKMLFCPQILTMNGEEASINVGRDVPVRLGGTTDGSGTTENIDYRETGTRLTIFPQISADKRVTLEIDLELSSLSNDTVAGIASPIINSTSIINKLTVNNNETILIGGIITKEKSETNSGIPFLKDIPYLGILFSGNSDTTSKQELVIFVKATVIERESDYQKAMKRYKESLKFKNESPELD